MKRGWLLLMLPLLAVSCNGDESRIETWTIAPEKGVTGIVAGFGHIPACIVKKETGNWEIFSGSIEGFTFEKGYETVLRVRIDPIDNPPADGPSYHYTMEELLSRTPSGMEVDPLTFSPEYEVIIASERTATGDYWIKDLRESDPQWMVFPWPIKGFDFTPGNEYHVRIQPVAEYEGGQNDLTNQHSWVVRYTIRELISYGQKPSEGLPAQP